jgi:hypothetical protein
LIFPGMFCGSTCKIQFSGCPVCSIGTIHVTDTGIKRTPKLLVLILLWKFWCKRNFWVWPCGSADVPGVEYVITLCSNSSKSHKYLTEDALGVNKTSNSYTAFIPLCATGTYITCKMAGSWLSTGKVEKL